MSCAKLAVYALLDKLGAPSISSMLGVYVDDVRQFQRAPNQNRLLELTGKVASQFVKKILGAGYLLSKKSVFLTSASQVKRHLPTIVGQAGGQIKAVRFATLLGVDAS